MTRAFRTATFLALLAGGVVLAPGCGSKNDCNTLPDLSKAPDSCAFPGGDTVTVNVRWCSCSSSITCDVTNEGNGYYQAEPKVSSCDATCETAGGTSCGTEVVPCVFQAPTAADTYHLVVRGGQVDQTIDFTVSGGSAQCNPT